MSPISLGLVGAGTFAREAHRPALQPLVADRKVVISAIWSRTLESATTLADLYAPHASPDICCGEEGLQKLLDRPDIDAVILAVPIPQLRQLAHWALKAGKHVLAEKPLGSDANDARRALEDYYDMGRNAPMYCIAENFRFESAVRRMAEVVSSGHLGSMVGIELSAHNCMKVGSKYARGWRIDEDNLGYIAGQLLDGGVHFIAGMRIAVNSDVSRVTARLKKISAHLPIADTVHALVEFENDVTGTAVVTYSSGVASWTMTVVGASGRTSLKRASLDGKFGYLFEVEVGNEAPETEFFAFTGIDGEISAFVESCRSGKMDDRLAAYHAFNDVATVQAFVDSNKTGQTVTVQRPPQRD